MYMPPDTGGILYDTVVGMAAAAAAALETRTASVALAEGNCTSRKLHRMLATRSGVRGSRWLSWRRRRGGHRSG